MFSKVFFLCLVFLFISCTETKIIESPRTTFTVSDTQKPPEIIWTSRTLGKDFDYLGRVKVRSWSYQGAIERLKEAGFELKADALIDVHYEEVGFLSAMEAIAIKYK